MRVRIRSAVLRNFRNVTCGKIDFPCLADSEFLSMKSDVLGIYGQNGSGKTTFIAALELLKNLLSGNRIAEQVENNVSKGSKEAELCFEFCVEDSQKARFRAIYDVKLGKEILSESVKASEYRDGKWTRLNPILECSSNTKDEVLTPETKRIELFGKKSESLDELKVTKLLCAKECRSLLFSSELSDLMSRCSGSTGWFRMFDSLRRFGIHDLFVITNRNSGLISLNVALPVSFRTDKVYGSFVLPLDHATVLPEKEYEIAKKVLSPINEVLRQIIPGMEIQIQLLGTELLENGHLGYRVQMVRTGLSAGDGTPITLPLKYESEGIKKIISFLHLFVSAYNSPGITLAIDELDSGIYEYLLGELLQIMQDSGLGQLIFTSHNLRPLEMLDSSSIVFTTTNPRNRYTRLANIKPTNNLRLLYFRDITLGRDGSSDELYQETNSIEIAHAMRKVGVSENDYTEAE